MNRDIPEIRKLKAHLKRRTEKQTKNKWVQYATEYASEIVFSDRKNEIRQYMDMVKDAVESINRKDRERKLFQKNRKIRSREKHAF